MVKLTGRQRSFLGCADSSGCTDLAQAGSNPLGRRCQGRHVGARRDLGCHRGHETRSTWYLCGLQAWAGTLRSPRGCEEYHWVYRHTHTADTTWDKSEEKQTQHRGTGKRSPLPPAVSLQRPLLTKHRILLYCKGEMLKAANPLSQTRD